MKELLHNFTTENTALIIIGVLIYFFAEFKSKHNDTEFSFKYWLKDNWMNIPITLLGVMAYFIVNDSIGKVEAFSIGVAPNLITDWVIDFINRKKIG